MPVTVDIEILKHKDVDRTYDKATDSLEAIADAVVTADGVVNAILTDTNELQIDWSDGGRLDLLLDAIPTTAMRGTDNAALASVLGALDTAAAQDADATDKPAIGLIKGIHDVLWDSDGIADWPAATAPASGISLAEVVRSVYNDTNEIQVDWSDGGRLDLLVDSILADTNELQVAISDGGRFDLLIDAIKAKTDNLPSDPADDSEIKAILGTPTASLKVDHDDIKGPGFATGTDDLKTLRVNSQSGYNAVVGTNFIPNTHSLKQIKDEVEGLAGAAMRGTDNAATAIALSGHDDKLDLIPTTAMRGTDNAAAASVLGTLTTAAAQDADATTEPVMGLIKGIHDVLWDSDGITDWPAATAPASGISLAEVVRSVYNDTNEIQVDWSDGGRLDLLLDAIPTTAMRGTDNAALASVLGALDTAAAQDGDATTETAIALIKGVHDVLWDADGVAAWAAAAAPGNGVSIAEALRSVYDDTNEIQVDWSDGGRLDLLLDAIPTTAMRGTDNGATAVALSGHDDKLDAIDLRTISTMTFWSDIDNVVDLPAAAADTDLPDVVVAGIPATATLVRNNVIFKVRMIENTASGGANAIEGAQDIRVMTSGGTWGADDLAAINLADNMWTVAAETREGGDVLVGDIDVKAEVEGDGTYYLRFEDADVDYDYLRLNDVQVGIKFWFS